MSKDLKISVTPEGDILRDEDKKHLAVVDLETGEVSFTNAAYAKGNYREVITKRAEEAVVQKKAGTLTSPKEIDSSPKEDEFTTLDSRVPSSAPPRDPSLGSFSAAHINYDHATLSDEEFAAKYKTTAQSQLEFLACKPKLFADLKSLEERFASIAAA